MSRNASLPVLIVSPPRVASSFLARALVDGGLTPFDGGGTIHRMQYAYNPNGYFEDVWLTLLNDQIIRAAYSLGDSFLHISGSAPRLNMRDWDKDFAFDLNPHSIEMPADYLERCQWYTGNEWDVWGLSRMQPGGKWHKAYSENGLHKYSDLLSAICIFKKIVRAANRHGERLVVKDPRLALSLPILGIDAKVILLSRAKESHLTSMRSHYGPRLFTNQPFAGYDWVSNHFNYRISPQTFEDYLEGYGLAINRIRGGFETLEVLIDDLTDETIEDLEAFIEMKVPMLRRGLSR